MKRIIRTAAALLTAICIFVMSVPSAALSVEPRIITGEFSYYSATVNRILTHTYHYCDDYFSGSGKSRNEHLRTVSLDISITAFGSFYGGDNAKQMFAEMGFDENSISVQQMNETPTEHSLGTVIAHKKTEYGDIVAAVVRGHDYGLEWQNNVTVGKNGDAEGFSEAARKLTERIKEYETTYGLKGAKLWLMGYSRGGGVVDLAGRNINESLGDYGITDDDLYAYTFEAPAASERETGYENIHNVLNPNDAITMFYPSKWGFHHSGVTETIISETPRLKRMNLNYIGDLGIAETGETSSMIVIEREFADWLATSISRRKYAENSVYFGVLIQLFMTMSNDELILFTDYLSWALSSVTDRYPLFDIVMLLSDGSGSSGYNDRVEKLCDAIGAALDSEDHSRLFSDSEYAKVREAVIKIVRMLIPAVKADFSLSHPLERACSFFGNIVEIAKQHFSETILYAAEALDSYFTPVSVAGAEITVDGTTAEVTSVTVDSKLLIPGLDYTLRYKNSSGEYTEPLRSGRYTVVVSGIGSYTGTAEKDFSVKFIHFHHWTFTENGDTVTVRCTEPGCDYYGTNVEYTVRLAVNGKEYDGTPAEGMIEKSPGFPEEITVGEIKYTGGKNGDLSAIGRYRAEVTVYAAEQSMARSAFCDYSIKRISAKPEKLAIYVADDMPAETEVFYDGRKLRPLSDYTVSFNDENGEDIASPTAPGEYTVVWKGRGIYSGTVTRQFTVRNDRSADTTAFPIILTVVISASAVFLTLIIAIVVYERKNKPDKQQF